MKFSCGMLDISLVTLIFWWLKWVSQAHVSKISVNIGPDLRDALSEVVCAIFIM